METLILIVHVFVALGLIGLVMLQQGKGAETGASFGAGASQTVFGSSGSGNFLSRSTAVLATIFFVTSIGLAIIAKEKAGGLSSSGTLGIPEAVEVLTGQDSAELSTDAPAVHDIKSEAGGFSVDSLDAPVLDSAESSEEGFAGKAN